VCASDVVRKAIELWSLCGSTYILRCTQATLDAGVQDAAHRALIALCQELRDLDSQQLSEKETEYV
jgi:hypothetical protein